MPQNPDFCIPPAAVSLKFHNKSCSYYVCFMLFYFSPVHTSFSVKAVNSSRSNTVPISLLGITWTCLEENNSGKSHGLIALFCKHGGMLISRSWWTSVLALSCVTSFVHSPFAHPHRLDDSNNFQLSVLFVFLTSMHRVIPWPQVELSLVGAFRGSTGLS